jgi:hypothetical protein
MALDFNEDTKRRGFAGGLLRVFLIERIFATQCCLQRDVHRRAIGRAEGVLRFVL